MEATPVPIPNTEVKLHIADGTARVTVWESRSLPAFIYAPLIKFRGAFLRSGGELLLHCNVLGQD